MEKMTKQMHEIAVRTKQETVSMKIITLITLLFLPGTFISVCLRFQRKYAGKLTVEQTLMSTDIIQYQNVPPSKDGEMFSMPALRLFLAIMLPMMFFTFVAWAGIYYYVKWREQEPLKREDVETAETPYSDDEKEVASRTQGSSTLSTGVFG